MSYQYGASKAKPARVAMTADEVRQEMANLQRLRAAILAETEAKAKELERIRKARKRLEPVATYKPTPEALAYREQYGHIIAAQPAPLHGGPRGLRLAAAEAAAHDARKNKHTAA